MSVVSQEIAEKEVNKWLDELSILPEKRTTDGVKDMISHIVKSVCDGDLVFNSDETLTQKLKSPLGDGSTKEIVYDFRFEIGDFQSKMKGTNAFDDEVGFVCAKLSLISSAKYPVDLFKRMKRADYFIAKQLVVFF